MKSYLKKSLIIIFCLAVLVVAFMYGGDAPSVSYRKQTESATESVEKDITSATEIKETEVVSEPESISEEETKEASADRERETDLKQKEKEYSGPKVADTEEKKEEKIPQVQNSCTLSVRCDTIFENIEWFNKDKFDILPENGVIYPEQMVSFTEGESVFDVLLREMVKNKIHFEYMDNPLYKTAYIEGIANIYEFDCGELSGWMYRVNGTFPGYGCSKYILKNGDKIEWIYTCDLGKDIGGDKYKQME